MTLHNGHVARRRLDAANNLAGVKAEEDECGVVLMVEAVEDDEDEVVMDGRDDLTQLEAVRHPRPQGCVVGVGDVPRLLLVPAHQV